MGFFKRKVLVGAAAGVAGLIALLCEYGHRQITQAHRTDFRDDPTQWGLDEPEQVVITSRDGLRLHSWLFQAPEAKGTVIALHGHGGNKDTLLPLAHMLYPRFNVLMLDHRAHGESAGTRTTIGFEERLDVHAAVDFLESRKLGPVGIFGMSMGGATAILAVAEDERIAAVVADSPYARLRWAVAEAARLRGYPGMVTPGIAYLGCMATAMHLGYPIWAFDPVEVVSRIAPRPLFIMHGELDELIPVSNAHKLYSAAREPKSLWLIPGLQHCKAMSEMTEEFGRRILEFFEGSLLAQTDDEDDTAPDQRAAS